MIAVMIVGLILKGQRYPLSQWLQMLSIAGGISLFALTKDSKKASDRLMAHNPLLGYSLLIINLGMDGYTNVQQDTIKKRHPKTTSFSMMAYQVREERSAAKQWPSSAMRTVWTDVCVRRTSGAPSSTSLRSSSSAASVSTPSPSSRATRRYATRSAAQGVRRGL